METGYSRVRLLSLRMVLWPSTLVLRFIRFIHRDVPVLVFPAEGGCNPIGVNEHGHDSAITFSCHPGAGVLSRKIGAMGRGCGKLSAGCASG
jgi:hypothetical protein